MGQKNRKWFFAEISKIDTVPRKLTARDDTVTSRTRQALRNRHYVMTALQEQDEWLHKIVVRGQGG